MQNEAQKKQSTAWAVVVVLAIAVAMLGFLFFQQRAQLTDQEATIMEKVNEVSATRTKLDSISTALNMKIAEVEKLGGDVEELNKVKAQLEADKSSLARSKKVETGKYLAKIKQYETYLAEKDTEIARLREENQLLASSNDSLNVQVGSLRSEREQLVQRQTELSDSVMTYTAQNKELSDKVNRAAALKAQNLKVLAINSRGKTKDDDAYKAKRVDKLKLVFDLPENPLTRQETKDIYVRVLDPEGAVVSDDATGSGEFEINGQETKFTSRESVAYQNNNQKVEMIYDNTSQLRPGKYSVELYAEGYRIGGGNFVIR
jgi:predicted nuclease with TOPRIM domain